jgi:hypothetical protein
MNSLFRPSRRSAVSLLLILALSATGAAWAESKAKEAVCYVIIEEGTSTEGNSLFLSKMGIDTELLSRVAPTRFSFDSAKFLSRAAGSFAYQAGSPLLIERSGRLALYSVAIKYSAGRFPRAAKTVAVTFSLSDLEPGGDAIQPAAKAIELAAKAAGMRSGTAWIVDMEMPSDGHFSAKVALAK